MLISEKNIYVNLVDTVNEILNSDDLFKNEDNLYYTINSSWKFKEQLEIFINPLDKKLVFKTSNRPLILNSNLYSNIDLLGSYLKIGSIDLKLYSRNIFLKNYIGETIPDNIIREFLQSKKIKKKILSLTNNFLQNKLIFPRENNNLKGLLQFYCLSNEVDIVEKTWTLFLIDSSLKKEKNYLDLKLESKESLLNARDIILENMYKKTFVSKNKTYIEFLHWFDNNILRNNNSLMKNTSILKLYGYDYSRDLDFLRKDFDKISYINKYQKLNKKSIK